jgi:hypothetical protein
LLLKIVHSISALAAVEVPEELAGRTGVGGNNSPGMVAVSAYICASVASIRIVIQMVVLGSRLLHFIALQNDAGVIRKAPRLLAARLPRTISLTVSPIHVTVIQLLLDLLFVGLLL